MKTKLIPHPRSTRRALDRVLGDLKVLAGDAELLLEATRDDASAVAVEARRRLGTAIAKARTTYQQVEAQAVASLREAAHETDAAIRANPYKSIGIAVGAGVVLGLLCAGGRDRAESAE